MITLKDSVQALVSNLLEEFRCHPMIAPYLNVLRENPPKIFLHQCELAVKLSLRKPVRVFIADEIGLGKTFSAIALAKILENYGRIRKVLIIVPRVLVIQWKNELLRAGIPSSKIHHLERTTISWKKEQGFPEGYYIVSMDLLKREKHIEEVSKVSWDLIIVDEAHKFGKETERFENIGKNLVEKYPGKNVIFLSATPHRGDSVDYLSRLELIDPFLVGGKDLDNRQFYELTHGAIVFRRTKEDVNNIYECRKVFPDAKFYACLVKTRRDEEKFVEDLVLFLRTKLMEFAYEIEFMDPRVIPLLSVLVFKRASSSPFSAYTTLQRMLAKRTVDEKRVKDLVESVDSFFGTGYDDYEYDEGDPEKVFEEFIENVSPILSEQDKETILNLRNMAESIMVEGDSKLNALCALLEDFMDKKETKVVVFTEYKDTLDYIIKSLVEKRHPEWKNSILRLSSDETADINRFQEIKGRFERDPAARILFATDVVAEGVNLQVANILINYEIPWSLVKLEQRIGRVWRLGQKNTVEVYTLFMNNVADKAALEAMYRKLGSLKTARLKPRPFTGEEIFLYAEEGEVKDMITASAYAIAVEEKGKKKFTRITEAKTILAYLKDNTAGLEKLIESIIKTKVEIEKEMYSKGILYMPKTRVDVENSLLTLGFRDHKELMLSLQNLLKSVSAYYGLNFKEEDNVIKVSRGNEMPVTIENVSDIYGFLHKISSCNTIPFLVAYGEGEDTLALYRVLVKGGKSNELLYSEPIGVFVNDGKILRGSELLKTVSDALSNCVGVAEQDNPIELSLAYYADTISCLKQNIISLLNPIKNYVIKLESMGWRNSEIEWLNPSNIKVEVSKPIGYIQFIRYPSTEALNIPQKLKDEIEEKAVQLVLESESREGRTATLVPESEHYDIKSVNLQSGEVRKIEVKGHAGSEVYGELTGPEAGLAERERENFWLYIVYDVLKDNPKILKFKNPIETMNWKTFEKVERRYIFWPKGYNLKTDFNKRDDVKEDGGS